jgi:hypothetical protein
VLLINDGYKEIANILLLDDSSIRHHIEEYLNYKKLTTIVNQEIKRTLSY